MAAVQVRTETAPSYDGCCQLLGDLETATAAEIIDEVERDHPRRRTNAFAERLVRLGHAAKVLKMQARRKRFRTFLHR